MKLFYPMQRSKLKNCKVTGRLHAKTLVAQKRCHKLGLALRSQYSTPLGPKPEVKKKAFFLSPYQASSQLRPSKTSSIPQKQILSGLFKRYKIWLKTHQKCRTSIKYKLTRACLNVCCRVWPQKLISLASWVTTGDRPVKRWVKPLQFPKTNPKL